MNMLDCLFCPENLLFLGQNRMEINEYIKGNRKKITARKNSFH